MIGVGLWKITDPMPSTTPFQDCHLKQCEYEVSNYLPFMTEGQVRKFPLFKDATTEEVEHIVSTLHELALISYHLFCLEKPDNKQVKKLL